MQAGAGDVSDEELLAEQRQALSESLAKEFDKKKRSGCVGRGASLRPRGIRGGGAEATGALDLAFDPPGWSVRRRDEVLDSAVKWSGGGAVKRSTVGKI